MFNSYAPSLPPTPHLAYPHPHLPSIFTPRLSTTAPPPSPPTPLHPHHFFWPHFSGHSLQKEALQLRRERSAKNRPSLSRARSPWLPMLGANICLQEIYTPRLIIASMPSIIPLYDAIRSVYEKR